MIILLTGKAATGKSTVATYLQAKYKFQQDQLAAPLKRLTADVFCIPLEILNPETEEHRFMREQSLTNWPGWTPRKLLQFIGTELFRTKIQDDVWVRSLWLRVTQQGGNWVISDVRFPNEQSFFIERCKAGEVFTIKLTRPGHDGNVGLKGHASEAYDLAADFTISNHSDFAYLYRQVDEIMQSCHQPLNISNKLTQVVV